MKNIAVITAGITIKTTYEIGNGINTCARENNCNVFYFSSQRRFDETVLHDIGEYNIFNLPDYEQFDGVIIIDSTINNKTARDKIYSRVNNSQVPSVSIEHYQSNMYNVMIDNISAMTEMVEHFVKDHGFKRIGFVTGPKYNIEAQHRFKAYRDVLKENGIEYDESLVYYGDYLRPAGMAAAEYFLSMDEMPEGIVCSNDLMARGMLFYYANHGVRVPEDVAVAGFDDDYEARYYEPSLTTIGRDQYETGYVSCKKLIEGLEWDDKGGTHLVSTRLIRRNSCGCESTDVIDEKEFRTSTFKEQAQTDIFVDNLRNMTIDLNAVETEEELKEALKRYVALTDCQAFYMFLTDDWMNIRDKVSNEELTSNDDDYIKIGYGDKSNLFFGYADGEFFDDAKLDFSILLKNLKESTVGGNVFVVSPLHFKDRCFGYTIFCNSDVPFISNLYYNWVINIGNGLEHVRENQLLRKIIKKLDSLWIYDNLTGLYNRSGFNKYVDFVWQECIKKKISAMILFIDADGLKNVNDNYGHDEGDRLITAISSAVKAVKKHGELGMRYGGDEFVVIAPGLGEEEALKYREAIQTEIKNFNRSHFLPYKVSASIGTYIADPSAGIGIDEAIEMADKAMYEEKKKKKENKQ